MKYKNTLIGFFLIGALSMLIMGLPYLFQHDFGILKGKAFKDTLWYQLAFFAHISFGLIAIIIGPFQFMDQLIHQYRNIHKKLGYLYVAGVGISSLAGLIIAPFAMGGIITSIGFSILALLWFSSLLLALKKVLTGNIKAHRKWMQINYALTFAAITQRTLLLLAFLPNLSFMPIYQLSAWLPWMFNLMLVFLLINKEESYT